MDLTLRDGINLQEAITSAKQIDEQSKTAGFYQEVLDHVARQDYGIELTDRHHLMPELF